MFVLSPSANRLIVPTGDKITFCDAAVKQFVPMFWRPHPLGLSALVWDIAKCFTHKITRFQFL